MGANSPPLAADVEGVERPRASRGRALFRCRCTEPQVCVSSADAVTIPDARGRACPTYGQPRCAWLALALPRVSVAGVGVATL